VCVCVCACARARVCVRVFRKVSVRVVSVAINSSCVFVNRKVIAERRHRNEACDTQRSHSSRLMSLLTNGGGTSYMTTRVIPCVFVNRKASVNR
jgi:hypothetical protein